jgi:hypothetical protein
MEDVGVLGRFFGSHLPFRQRFLYEFPMAQKSIIDEFTPARFLHQ